MKYLALFENWQERFMTRYEKALKLFNLGVAPSPFNMDSQPWEDFKELVARELREMGFRIEELFTVTDNRAVLEISYTQRLKHGPEDTRYLRMMIIEKSDEPEKIYLVGPDYLEAISIKDPLLVLSEILRIAQLLKPKD